MIGLTLSHDNFIIFSRRTIVESITYVNEHCTDQPDKRHDISYDMYISIISSALERNESISRHSNNIIFHGDGSLTDFETLLAGSLSTIVFEASSNLIYYLHKTAIMVNAYDEDVITRSLSIDQYARYRFAGDYTIVNFIQGIIQLIMPKSPQTDEATRIVT